MKTLITLGIALLAVTNTNAETHLVEGVVSNELTAAVVQAQQFEQKLSEITSNEPGKFAPVADTAVLNPESVVGMSVKSLEEVIAEDKKITESHIADEGYLFFQETAVEETIANDNQIIEAGTEQVRPLYLELTMEDVIRENNDIIEAVIPDAWNASAILADF